MIKLTYKFYEDIATTYIENDFFSRKDGCVENYRKRKQHYYVNNSTLDKISYYKLNHVCHHKQKLDII